MPRKTSYLDATGLLSSRAPSPRERLAGLLADTRGGYQGLMGLLGQSAAQTPEAGWRDAFSPFGLLGAYDGGEMAAQGYLGGSAAATGLGLLAAMPVPGAKAAKKIRAYHGSPHSFDKFSMDKIGTGEGAQAYGHGLYFAENEGVARQYRDDLAPLAVEPGSMQEKALMLIRGQGGKDNAISFMEQNFPAELSQAGNNQYKELLAEVRRVEPSGSMYEVEINADPDSFLDWDKPLSEQPQARSLWERQPQELGLQTTEYRGTPWHTTADGRMLAIADPAEDVPGSELYAMINKANNSPEAASNRLRQAGIPGIKYLDAGSRGAGDGTRNFVVFDDSIISIVRKYGIAGALAAGAISQSDALQLQEQGYQ